MKLSPEQQQRKEDLAVRKAARHALKCDAMRERNRAKARRWWQEKGKARRRTLEIDHRDAVDGSVTWWMRHWPRGFA